MRFFDSLRMTNVLVDIGWNRVDLPRQIYSVPPYPYKKLSVIPN